MKTPSKLLIVAALAIAVVAALTLKKGKSPVESKDSNSTPPLAVAAGDTTKVTPVTASSLPKLLDLGAGKCIPCKMMAPVLEELRKGYAGRMEVVFIDVWENPDAGKPYDIDGIPTQIFYDAEGKELFRHSGFFGKDDILAKWKELGFTFDGKAAQSGGKQKLTAERNKR